MHSVPHSVRSPKAATRTASAFFIALLALSAPGWAGLAIFRDGSPDPFAGGTYSGTQDTMMLDQGGGTGSDNFGGRTDWEIGSNGSAARHSLLRFDLASMAGQYASINSVTLKLTVNYVNGADTGQIFRLATANTGWIEGTEIGAGGTADPGMTTWDQRVQGSQNWAGSAGASTAGTDYLSSTLGTFAFDGTLGNGSTVSIALTDPTLIDDWVSGNNAGLFLRTLGESGLNRIDFYSADYTTDPAMRPELLIDFVPVPEPATFAVGLLCMGVGMARRRRG